MTNATDDRNNEREALVFFNNGGRVSGFYRDAQCTEYKISGGLNRETSTVAFRIIDEEGEERGEGQYRARKNPGAGKPVADGVITFDGTSYPVVAWHVNFTTGSHAGRKGHGVRPDKMAAAEDAPF